MLNSKRNITNKMILSFLSFLLFICFIGFASVSFILKNYNRFNYPDLTDDIDDYNKNEPIFSVIKDSISSDSFYFNLLLNQTSETFYLQPNLIYLTTNNILLNTIFVGGQTDQSAYNLFYEVRDLKPNHTYTNFKLITTQDNFEGTTYEVSSSVAIKTDNNPNSVLILILILLAIFILFISLLVVISLIILGVNKKKKLKTIYYEQNTYYEWKNTKKAKNDYSFDSYQEEYDFVKENDSFDFNNTTKEIHKESKNYQSNRKIGYKLYKPSLLKENSKKAAQEEFSLSAQPFDKISNNKKVRKRRRDFNNLVEENEFFKVKLNDEEEFTFIDEYEF